MTKYSTDELKEINVLLVEKTNTAKTSLLNTGTAYGLLQSYLSKQV